MRTRSALVLATLLVSLSLSSLPAAAGSTAPTRLVSGTAIFVSPSGDDNNPGTQLAPYRSLARAQSAVRSMNRHMTSDITVYLEDGTYRLSHPLQLGRLDSGTNGHDVVCSYDRRLSFVNDRFVHLGAAALNLDNGSQSATVEGCVFTDPSGNGIEIGNVNLPQACPPFQTRWIKVIDNHLYDLPVEYHGGVAIFVGYAANTAITHNQIDHVSYTAISIGWGGWPDKVFQPPVPNFGHDDVVSDNLIYDFMEIPTDGGGIYVQGITGKSMTTGLKVTGNVIHDQIHWGNALKSDNGATYGTYTYNVLYDDDYD